MDEHVKLSKMNAEENVNVGTCMYRTRFWTSLSLYTGYYQNVFFSMLEDYRKNNIMLKNAFCSDFLLIPYPKYV